MKTFRIAANLIPHLFAECSACQTDLVLVARVVGGSVEFAVPDKNNPVAETAETKLPDTNPLPPSNPDDQGHPGLPNDFPGESVGEPPPLQIGLPLHPDLPHPPHSPHPGGTPTHPSPIRFERRPVSIRLLHVDERRGQGSVLVGRAVRRVEINGSIAALRELREIVSASNPQLTTVGTFDVSSCVSQPNITLDANDLLRQFASADQTTVAREPEIN